MNPDTLEFLDGYNEWYNNLSPGGVVEMKKLKGGKMKDEIKEIKKEALKKFGEQENPEPWFSPREVLDIIAEIESLETKIKQLKEKIGENYWVKKADDKQIEELNKEIKQLQAVREAAMEMCHHRLVLCAIDHTKANILWQNLEQALAETKDA